MSISRRIVLLVLLTFMAIASIGGFAIYQSSNNAAEVKQVTGISVPSTLASSDLVVKLKEVQIAAMTYTTSPDTTLAAQAKTDLDSARLALKKALDLQIKEASGDKQKKLTLEAESDLSDYLSAIDDTSKFKEQGRTDLASANFFANVVQYQLVLQQIVDTLRIEKNRSNDAAISQLNKNLGVTISTVTGITAISIVVLGVLSLLLYRQIVRPISNMKNMMSEIALKQDFSCRVPVDRMDEIGHSVRAFNTMLEKIEESSSLLRARTNDIQTMLQHILQGILTIGENGVIHHEYSKHLETVFETQKISGRSVMDLVFAQSNLGADGQSAIEAVIAACIGEDEFNYSMNAHLLVSEIEKTMPDGRKKILDLSWSPIVDNESGCIVRILLCIRDATELRQLAIESREQRLELEIIGEILAVTQEKFHEFMQNSLELIANSESLLAVDSSADHSVINCIFRNIHTIKGNARTYGLLFLTNVVHEAEQFYAELRLQEADATFDQFSLYQQLSNIRHCLERYARTSEVSLGRKGPGRRGNVDRYLMVDKQQILHSIYQLEAQDLSNPHAMLQTCQSIRRMLRLLGTESISEILSGIVDALPSLAAELGKETPVLRIEDHGLRICNQASGLLKNIFTHLLRNALDHGIETAAVRLAAGKPAMGTINLSAQTDPDVLRLTLSDDGRGIALRHIRQIALSKGLIAADAHLTDTETALLIFHAGFSTAEKITEISGRGVGMDAVLSFVQREQGRIELTFADDASGANYRRFHLHIILPAHFAVSTDDTAPSTSRLYLEKMQNTEIA